MEIMIIKKKIIDETNDNNNNNIWKTYFPIQNIKGKATINHVTEYIPKNILHILPYKQLKKLIKVI